jgi:hypothetical protein
MRKPPAPDPAKVYDELFPEKKGGSHIVAALIDPSLWEDLDELLRYHSPEWYILFDKRPTADLVRALPRIVRLEPNAIFTGIVLAQYGKRRNIYLRAALTKKRPDLCDLAMSLKDFAHVKLPGNEWTWFRYYDPVVFAHFMKVATDPQKKALFGPHIQSFFAESVWDGVVTEYPAPETDLPAKKPVSFTPEQKEEFDEYHYDQFKRELTDYLLYACFAGITAEREIAAISAHIHGALELSQRLGAVQKIDCMEFVKLGVRHGFDCYSTQEVDAILSTNGTIEEKIDRIQRLYEKRNDEFAAKDTKYAK